MTMRRSREFQYRQSHLAAAAAATTTADTPPPPTAASSNNNHDVNPTTIAFVPPMATTTTTTSTSSTGNHHHQNLSILEEDDIERQRKLIQEFNINMDTARLAQEAQEEELIGLAMELSITDHSRGTDRLSYNGTTTATEPIPRTVLPTPPQSDTPTPPPPRRRSILRPTPSGGGTSSRSLEHLMFNAARGPTTEPVSHPKNDGSQIHTSSSGSNSHPDDHHDTSHQHQAISRSMSERCDYHHHQNNVSSTGDIIHSHDPKEYDDMEDDDDDGDDDSDDISFEDLDPDDTPDLKRVQPQQQLANTSPSHVPRTEELRRKSTIPSLNQADLSATTLRFQQFSKSLPDGCVLEEALTRRRRRTARPGLVVQVHQAAPAVKPPGRPRTAASRQSPAIDDDVLRKLQIKAESSTGTRSASSQSHLHHHNDSASSNATAQKPGAVAIIGSVPAKSPEVRSAIVSHVLGSSSSNDVSSQIDHGTARGHRAEQRHSTSSHSTDATPTRKPGSNVSSNDDDHGVSNNTRTANANSATPQRSIAWNNGNLSQPPSASKAANSSDWPSLTTGAEQTCGRHKNHLIEQERRDLERALRESESSDPQQQPATTTPCGRTVASGNEDYDLTGASRFLSQEELLTIQEALNEGAHPVGSASQNSSRPPRELEDEAIARALREADEEEERRSFELAIQMQREESKQFKSGIAGNARLQQHGNVQSMTRQEYQAQIYEQQWAAAVQFDRDDEDDKEHAIDGFRINSSAPHKWSRRDQTSVAGPNQEVRTKHDRTLHNEANAYRLGILSADGNTATASVGNQAYNSFLQSMKTTSKGVAMKGTGRAGSDTDATKGGAMDSAVRQHISRAINNEIIEKCNGVVKEGKEAVVYHADKGTASGGFDVAIKVFKKISEFRNRGYYVEGDPRYHGNASFRNLSSKEQLELWTEKEFRNLTRASRAGVPVPIPLFYKENVLFMRFLGDDGWPAPQLRVLQLNHGSRRWGILFSQIMEAVKLYEC